MNSTDWLRILDIWAHQVRPRSRRPRVPSPRFAAAVHRQRQQRVRRSRHHDQSCYSSHVTSTAFSSKRSASRLGHVP
jgi:hypothetical protein